MSDNRFYVRLGSFFVALAWLACCLCYFIFQTPTVAHAAEEDSYWLEAMDYGGFSTDPNATYGTSSYFSPYSGNSTFYIILPRLMVVKFVDIIIYTGGGWYPAGLEFKAFGNSLSVQRWGEYENYWRLYGPVTTSSAQCKSIELNVFNPISNRLHMDVLSCRVSSNAPFTDISCNWSIYQDTFTTPDTFFPTYNSTDWRSTISEPGNLKIEISSLGWLKYQHIDVMLLLDVSHIDGITACLVNDQGYIPISYQYLNNGESVESFNLLSLSLDLTNVQPADSNLRIYITFHTESGSSNNFILYSVHGWSSTFAPDSNSFWFPKLIDAIKSMYNPPAGATPPAASPGMTDNQQIIQDGIGGIDSGLDAIATIPRPDLGSLDLPSSHLEDINYDSNVAHLTMLTHAQPFRLIFFFAALFMVVGVVIFGRRS